MKKLLGLFAIFAALTFTGVACGGTSTPPQTVAFNKVAKPSIQHVGGKARFIKSSCSSKPVETRVYVCQLTAANQKGTVICRGFYVAYARGYDAIIWPSVWVCGKPPTALPPIPPLSVFSPSTPAA